MSTPPRKRTLHSTTLTFKPGTRLVLENDNMSRKMFIIRSGQARVYRTYMNQKITLAVLGEGEVFGEMSFFDAEPRSASVEALTDLTAIVLDGETLQEDLAGLPDWIHPIFRTVFHRFRQMDQKLTVLQSMNEYQKRAFKTDNVAKTVYLELLRFNKTLKLLYERDAGKGPVGTRELYAELDDMLGTRTLGLRVYWRMINEHDFVDHLKSAQDGIVVLNEEALNKLNAYLTEEVEQETFLMLSHTSVALLGKLVGFTRAHEQPPGSAGSSEDTPVAVGFKEMELEKMPLAEEAITELVTRKVLQKDMSGEGAFVVQPGALYRLYTYQAMIKAFDHTIVHVES